MAEALFYMRVRGKISGPFDIATLQKLVKRGTLSRIHEISNNRADWNAAGQFEDLFPTVVAPVLQPIEVAEPATEPNAPESVVAPASPVAHALYYYTQRGSTVGPVPLAVLKTLAENGTLRRDDLVWRENSETGTTAAQMPALAPIFGGYGSRQALPYARASIQSGDLQAAEAAVAKQAQWMGVTVGATILLLMNLPWFTIDKKLVCWWDLYQAPQGNVWACLATTLVLCGIALCIAAPLMKGVARGILYLSLMAGSWIFLCVAMSNTGASFQIVGVLIVPVALSLLAGVCAFRGSAPESIPGRILLGICSGIASLGMLMAILDIMQENRPFTDVPVAIIMGGITVFIGFLSGLAAGIMGFIGLKPTFTLALNQATRISSLAGLLLPGVGIFVALSAASQADFPTFPSTNDIQFHWMFVTVMGRMLMLFYSCTALASVGIHELLTAAQVRSLERS